MSGTVTIPVWPKPSRIDMLQPSHQSIHAFQSAREVTMFRSVLTACLFLAFSCTPAFAQTAKLLKKYNHWSAYASTGSPTICFVVSEPIAKSPKGVKRGPVYFYITRYPNEGVDHQVSIKMGYDFKPGANVTVTVGSSKYNLYTKNEGAFVETKASEDQLVKDMKAGSKMTVKGTSARGTTTRDQYSLSGVTDALNQLSKGCK